MKPPWPSPARLREHEQAALALYESIGDAEAVVRARQGLVLGAYLAGDLDDARRLETKNLDDFRDSGSWYRTADSLTLLGAVELSDGDIEAADAHIREALSIVGPRELVAPIVGALGVAAHIAVGRGDLEAAAKIAGASIAFARQAEITNAMIEVLHMENPVETVRRRFGPAAEPFLRAGEALSMDEAVALASR